MHLCCSEVEHNNVRPAGQRVHLLKKSIIRGEELKLLKFVAHS